MTTTTAMSIVIGGGLLIGLITGLAVRKGGYSFWRYFVTGTIAGCGILGIIIKILRDYL
jgi:uncharacterized membrane protein (Fun14 family)